MMRGCNKCCCYTTSHDQGGNEVELVVDWLLNILVIEREMNLVHHNSIHA